LILSQERGEVNGHSQRFRPRSLDFNKFTSYLLFYQQRRENMKKSVKKLVLHRETLHSLEERGLVKVPGGGDSRVPQLEPTGCDCYTNNCYPATACLGSCSCHG
jgi:hypothetical protein